MLKTIIQTGILVVLTLSFLLVTQVKANAQKDTTALWNIITTGGNEYTGVIILQTETELKLKTNSIGTITLQLLNIKKMTKVKLENIRGNEVWLDNPQEGRYFFSPSSYGLKKGQGYYQNTWIFFNQVSYGITDNFSFGAGIVPLFLFSGSETPIWITPKFSIPIKKDNFAIGGGALLGTIIGAGSSYGIVYGTTTYGNREKNATLGLGYGYVGDDFADSPTVSLSTMFRVGKKGYFITENYFLRSGGNSLGLLSFGGRRFWNNVSLDFGGIIPISGDLDSFGIIPWLSFAISFGK